MIALLFMVRPGFAFTQAVVPPTHTSRQRSVSGTVVTGVSSRLHSFLSDKSERENDEINIFTFPELKWLQQVQGALQDVVAQFTTGKPVSSSSSSTSTTHMTMTSMTQQQQQPILTETGRYRRQLEMDVLASLVDSDDGLDELVHLWMHETGSAQAAAALGSMQESCSHGLFSELDELQNLIAQYPAWAEPRVRLAAVLYFKGRLEESRGMAIAAIRCKPWHFEAVQLLIMLALRQDDMGQALYWARRYALPNLRTAVGCNSSSSHGHGRDNISSSRVIHKRRRAWVERALHDAELQWQEAERVTQEAFQETSGLQQSFASNEQVWQ
jgi:hypothetical protein